MKHAYYELQGIHKKYFSCPELDLITDMLIADKVKIYPKQFRQKRDWAAFNGGGTTELRIETQLSL